MSFEFGDNKEEKDIFGEDSEYFIFDMKNSATSKKDVKNREKLNDFNDGLEENEMRSKSELNDDNKKYKIKFDEKKQENKSPIIFTGNKTIRFEANKEKKKIKKKKEIKKIKIIKKIRKMSINLILRQIIKI